VVGSSDIVPFLLEDEVGLLVVHSEKSVLLPTLSDIKTTTGGRTPKQMKFLKL